MLVIEDVHWADDATLDVLRYLVRRMAALPAVLVLTYRDDELDREHPLHGLLGLASRQRAGPPAAAGPAVARRGARLSAGTPVDAAGLYALTSGNPFFVHELLASADGDAVPPSIADAVLARVRQLDPAAQDVLEQLAVVPAALDRWLVDALAGAGADRGAGPAEQRGLLTVSARRISFRHELTRRAIEGAVPAARLMALNQRVLDVLTARPGADPSQIVHHAAQAGDAGRHHGLRAGRGAGRGRPRARTARRRRTSGWCWSTRTGSARRDGPSCSKSTPSRATRSARPHRGRRQRQAVELEPRATGPTGSSGPGCAGCPGCTGAPGDRAGAERAGARGDRGAERAGEPGLLALALSNQSQLLMLEHRTAEAIELGERAVALAREAGTTGPPSHALNNIGHGAVVPGRPGRRRPCWTKPCGSRWPPTTPRKPAGPTSTWCWTLLDWFRLDEAERYLPQAMKLAEEAEFLGFLSYMRTAQARLALARGQWDDAVRYAELGLELSTSAHRPTRWPALTVLARVAVRRGQPDAADLLEQAWDLVAGSGELQRTGPVAAARAEHAWLRGDDRAVRDLARPVYQEAARLRDLAQPG